MLLPPLPLSLSLRVRRFIRPNRIINRQQRPHQFFYKHYNDVHNVKRKHVQIFSPTQRPRPQRLERILAGQKRSFTLFFSMVDISIAPLPQTEWEPFKWILAVSLQRWNILSAVARTHCTIIIARDACTGSTITTMTVLVVWRGGNLPANVCTSASNARNMKETQRGARARCCQKHTH